MNPQILMVIDNHLNPDKYTKEQLEQNAADAYADAYAYATDADAAAYAAITAADAATYAAYAYAFVDYWLDQYFKYTGENKQDYIDAINKDNKQ